MRPVRFLVSLLFLVVTVGLVVPARASSAPAAAKIKLTPSFGPPTSRVRLAGRGFGGSETVDISFDTTPVATVMTDPTGAFIAETDARDLISEQPDGLAMPGLRTTQQCPAS